MDLTDALTRLTHEADDLIALPPPELIEQRAAARRRSSNIRDGAMLICLVAALVLFVARSDVFSDSKVDPTNSAVGDAIPNFEASATPTQCPVDACGPGKPLERGAAWLGSVLEDAGIEYVDEYRVDGGGFHLLPDWQMMLSALPPEDDPSGWALSHGYRPYWDANGTTVFGSVDESSPIGHFYWQAGAVDTWVEIGWNSEISSPQDVRQVIDKIIAEQQQSEYPYEE